MKMIIKTQKLTPAIAFARRVLPSLQDYEEKRLLEVVHRYGDKSPDAGLGWNGVATNSLWLNAAKDLLCTPSSYHSFLSSSVACPPLKMPASAVCPRRVCHFDTTASNRYKNGAQCRRIGFVRHHGAGKPFIHKDLMIL
jgi:hypothetical protein